MTFTAFTQHARLFLMGAVLLFTAYHAWFLSMRRNEVVLRWAGMWGFTAFAVLLGRYVQQVSDDPAVILTGVRIAHTGLFGMVPIALFIFHEMRGAPRRWWFWYAIAITSATVPLTWIPGVIIGDMVQRIPTADGDAIWGPVPLAIGVAALPYIAAVCAVIASALRRGKQSMGRSNAVSLAVVALVYLPSQINDALLFSGAVLTLETHDYALALVAVASNLRVMERARELFSELEQTVAARTRSLEEGRTKLAGALETRRRMLDAIPDPICVLQEGAFVYLNDAAIKFFGASLDELRGDTLTRFVGPDHRAAIDASISHPTPDGGVRSHDEIPFQVSGATRTTELAALSLDIDGRTSCLVVLHDVTERTQLMAKLQISDRLASVGVLAAGVAHEINNPLAFVSGNLECMKDTLQGELSHDDIHGEDGLIQLIDESHIGAQRIRRIVEDLRSFSSLNQDRTTVNVTSAMAQAVKMASASTQHVARVEVTHLDPPMVLGESGRLAQVFLNLLVNAIHAASTNSGADAKVGVTTYAAEDGSVVIDVEDNGAGIPADVLPRVLDPFVTTKKFGEGTGLGLSICHGIVRSLGGTINLSNRAGGGALARVTLPAAIDQEATGASPESGTRLTPTHRARVLVVDDEPILRKVVGRMLRDYEVTAVGSGQEAADLMRLQDFDAIVSDLSMPDKTGADLHALAKELGCDERMIVLTGGAATDEMARFLKEAAPVTLFKPVAREALIAAVDRCVGKRDSKRRVGIVH